MSVDLSIIAMILSGILSIIAAITVAKNNNKSEGRQIGVLINDVDYMKRGVDEMRFEQRENNRRTESKLDKVTETVLKHEPLINQALEESKKAYEHAENAHKRLNKNGGNQ